jgi:hypothetical protein
VLKVILKPFEYVYLVFEFYLKLGNFFFCFLIFSGVVGDVIDVVFKRGYLESFHLTFLLELLKFLGSLGELILHGVELVCINPDLR